MATAEEQRHAEMVEDHEQRLKDMEHQIDAVAPPDAAPPKGAKHPTPKRTTAKKA